MASRSSVLKEYDVLNGAGDGLATYWARSAKEAVAKYKYDAWGRGETYTARRVHAVPTGNVRKNPSKRKTLKRVRKALTKYVRGSKNPRVKLPASWTSAQVRVLPNGQMQVKVAPSKSGGRIVKGVRSVKPNSRRAR